MSDKTILLAEDDASVRLIINQTLAGAGYTVRATSSAEALERWVRAGEGDVVVTDVYLGDTSIFDLLPALKLARPDLPFIVLSGQNTILTAASAAEHGAYDYLPKPFDIDALALCVARAIASTTAPAVEIDPDLQRALNNKSLPLIGRSDAMQDIYKTISRVMNAKLPVLIEGESGTGKELTARAIHQLGFESDSQFVSLDLASMSEEEISHRLFGEEGRNGAAHLPSGTLYLDEVGDLNAAAQGLLVRLMRDMCGPRIILSTRLNLKSLVGEGRFREDLFYRLNVLRIGMPPLRERKEDIPDLAQAFLVQAGEMGLPVKTLHKRALERLVVYDWPGNVRELENLLMRLAALGSDTLIHADDVARELHADIVHSQNEAEGFEEAITALLQRYVLGTLMASADSEGGKAYAQIMEQVDRPLIKLALSATSGNKVKAARLLGLNRNTLRAKINSLNIAQE